MQRYPNILTIQSSPFGNSEMDRFWIFENIDYQYQYFYRFVSNFTGKEKDSETGYYAFGARYYDCKLSGLFLSVDPMSDKYPSISPYAYCSWNPVKFVDPDGREIDPYLIYDDKTKKLQIWDDNNTSDDYSDDLFLGEYDAHNNVTSYSKGKWPDGKYEIIDTENAHMHGDDTDNRGIKKDSPNGSYGEGGIFRANSFKEDNGTPREGLGIHAGREANPNFYTRRTDGCIRTTPEAIEAINNAIAQYGPLRSIIVRNNKTSSKSSMMNDIKPQKKPILNQSFSPMIFTPVIDNTYVFNPYEK